MSIYSESLFSLLLKAMIANDKGNADMVRKILNEIRDILLAMHEKPTLD